ncbi:hypothetical protein [Haliangium sp.]|uniref:hypothetical protein n=1 Tax=Haliangium sp. TaxID=2663208 RepID=UPI003D148968
MRVALAILLGLVFAAQSSCFRQSYSSGFRTIHGTCEGVCDHYLACKAERGDEVPDATRGACQVECREIFSGPEALVAFERLSCDDAIAFVEGSSGRGPGQPQPHG